MKVQNRLDELLAIKARKEGRRISRRDLERETGISLTSIQNWANNRVQQFHSNQIATFCEYFGCGIEDLLILVPDDAGELAPEMETPLLRAS